MPPTCLLAVLSASAVDAAPVASTDGASLATIWELAVKGGIVMIPIALCSLLGLAIAVERLISTRRGRVVPPGFVDEAKAAIAQGPSAALAWCQAHPSPMSRILAAALRRWTASPEQLERSVAEAGLRETTLLRRGLRGLAVIAAISPLLGLLGTIFGMIKAFRTVAASAEALGRTEMLAGGIYEAMVTTAAGLIVAIPALLLHHFLAARIERRALEMDEACRELLEPAERDASIVVAGGAAETAERRRDGAPDGVLAAAR